MLKRKQLKVKEGQSGKENPATPLALTEDFGFFIVCIFLRQSAGCANPREKQPLPQTINRYHTCSADPTGKHSPSRFPTLPAYGRKYNWCEAVEESRESTLSQRSSE